MKNDATNLAKEIYPSAVKEFNPTVKASVIGDMEESPMIEQEWTYPLSEESMTLLHLLHIAAGGQDTPHGRFIYDNQIVGYNVTNDGKFIKFILRPYTPVQIMNQVLELAANEIRHEPGMKLTAQMLDQLSVIGVTLADYSLILVPALPHLRPGMLRCKDKILFAINSLFPDVSGITIIDGVKELEPTEKWAEELRNE